jgi:acyl-CoA hydrolase
MTDPVARAEAHPPSYGRVELAMLMRGSEANLIGTIHGGEVMKLADSTAGAVGQRFTGGPVVTAALDEMVFLHPIRVGDIVRTRGQVNWSGHTSLEVGVRIEAQPHNDPVTPPLHVASAYFVMVAVDGDGRPRPVPQLVPEEPDDVRRHREALIRRAHRLRRKAEIAEGRGAS